MQFIRSNLIGLLALFVALGGTAYAVTKAPKNSVVSSSIKKGQVKTSDLATGAVTGAKLRANSVDSSKVADGSLTGGDLKDDSLTGIDIDESSLALSLSLANDTAPQPHEARITLAAGELVQPSGGAPPIIAPQFGIPTVFYDPGTDRTVFGTFEVPRDRAPGTAMHVHLLWLSNATGDAVWVVDFRTPTPGAKFEGASSAGPDLLASSTGTNVVIDTTAREIPSGAIQNGGPVALAITRDADEVADDLSAVANLILVEVRYTAEG